MIDSNPRETIRVSGYFMITSTSQARKVIKSIYTYAEANPSTEIVLGMDCEGIQKDKPLSLIQVN